MIAFDLLAAATPAALPAAPTRLDPVELFLDAYSASGDGDKDGDQDFGSEFKLYVEQHLRHHVSELIDAAVIRPGTLAASRMELIAAAQKARPGGFQCKPMCKESRGRWRSRRWTTFRRKGQ